ncbi:hypothetical protein Pyn_16971 [Prunus yedoensis var. nudiflora]|uniref:Uncharacterized protein n=1 Tax=Prunus yedoensis var. nudiflora TaxID=2094558 RepID=A0A314ZNQ7_PRUYE|nr:hypothetical protein Pyn_16971 [Prunus yedoensis var. nudiflora]
MVVVSGFGMARAWSTLGVPPRLSLSSLVSLALLYTLRVYFSHTCTPVSRWSGLLSGFEVVRLALRLRGVCFLFVVLPPS